MTGTFPPEVIAAAKAAQAKWRVFASVTLAQWALESAWGVRNMGSANNYFGIKPWKPGQPFVTTSTHEVIGGVWVAVPQRFCAFPSIAACIDAHGEFLNANRRYLPAFATKDGIAFAKAIAAAGYATDPNYAGKLISIIKAHGLLKIDAEPSDPQIVRVPPVTVPKSKTAPKAASGAIVVAAGSGAAAAAQSGHAGVAWALVGAMAIGIAIFLILHFNKKA